MKKIRQNKIIQLINKYDIYTQKELTDYLVNEGLDVTQATLSRDIRELKLSKILNSDGRRKYGATHNHEERTDIKYHQILSSGYLGMEMAQNMLVMRTAPGMAMGVATVVDSLGMQEVLGSIAGDDTLLIVARDNQEAQIIYNRIIGVIGD